jgi:hypothetical protein
MLSGIDYASYSLGGRIYSFFPGALAGKATWVTSIFDVTHNVPHDPAIIGIAAFFRSCAFARRIPGIHRAEAPKITFKA